MSPIVAIRGTIAAGMFFTPGIAAWVLGLKRVDPEHAYFFRIWGARNAALAALTARQPKETHAANIAVDLTDLVAGALLVRGRGASRLTTAAVLGLPALAVALKVRGAEDVSSG